MRGAKRGGDGGSMCADSASTVDPLVERALGHALLVVPCGTASQVALNIGASVYSVESKSWSGRGIPSPCLSACLHLLTSIGKGWALLTLRAGFHPLVGDVWAQLCSNALDDSPERFRHAGRQRIQCDLERHIECVDVALPRDVFSPTPWSSARLCPAGYDGLLGCIGIVSRLSCRAHWARQSYRPMHT